MIIVHHLYLPSTRSRIYHSTVVRIFGHMHEHMGGFRVRLKRKRMTHFYQNSLPYKEKYQLWITFFTPSIFGSFVHILKFFQLVCVECTFDYNILENGVTDSNSIFVRAIFATLHLICNRAPVSVADQRVSKNRNSTQNGLKTSETCFGIL